MSFIPASKEGSLFLDPGLAETLGQGLAEAHENAAPFPHTVIDDFLPEDVLRLCQARFPASPDPDSASFDRDQERYKTSYNPDYLDKEMRAVFAALNSRSFLCFVENVTGLEGLIPDPYFLGGGFHETRQGGHLGVHVDFNKHRKLGLHRRVNLLIYLNDDWDESYGGALELWDAKMTTRVQRVSPLANRCVMFTCSDESYHGHPEPVAHPEGKPRRSIALYYYTNTFDAGRRSYTTQFRKRPGSEDKRDWHVAAREGIRDVVPPILYRLGARAAARTGKALRTKERLAPSKA